MRVAFTVEGRGPFPMDMLRHDCAWPHDGNSAQAIVETNAFRRIELVGITAPASGRWHSFGWVVVEQHTE